MKSAWLDRESNHINWNAKRQISTIEILRITRVDDRIETLLASGISIDMITEMDKSETFHLSRLYTFTVTVDQHQMNTNSNSTILLTEDQTVYKVFQQFGAFVKISKFCFC